MTDHTAALLPCPFCNAPASVGKIGRDWWRLVVDHDDNCALDSDHRLHALQTEKGLEWLTTAWNTRVQPQQPACEHDPDRVAFEAWARRDMPRLSLRYNERLEGYMETETQLAYIAFCSARGPIAHPSQQEDDLRKAVQLMAGLLKDGEWAEILSSDPDVAALEAEISRLIGAQQEDDARDLDQDEADRFVVLKASGSRYAYVNDTLLGKTVKRYDVLRGDGWGDAKRHAERLNRDALNSAGEGGKNGAHE